MLLLLYESVDLLLAFVRLLLLAFGEVALYAHELRVYLFPFILGQSPATFSLGRCLLWLLSRLYDHFLESFFDVFCSPVSEPDTGIGLGLVDIQALRQCIQLLYQVFAVLTLDILA